MKRLVSLSFLLCVAVCITNAAHSPISNPTVLYVVNAGGELMDGTYNQGIYEAGLAATQAAGGTFTATESATTADEVSNLETAAKAGTEILMGSGTMSASLLTVAEEYPNTLFAMLDGEFDNQPANIVSAFFRADQAGFLAGVLAGSVSVNRSVACIGALQIGPILGYCNGFRAGFMSACQDPECMARVDYIPSFSDTAAGAASALHFANTGADVIFAPAGTTGGGAVLAAAQHGTYCIGVDVDEYYTTLAGQPIDVTRYLLSSARKRTDLATTLLLEAFFDGSYVDGSIKVFDVNSGGIDLADCHDSCDVWTTATKTAIQSATLGLQQNIISTGVDSTSGQLLWTGAANDAVWARITPWGTPPAARRLHSFVALNSSYLVTFGGYDALQTTLGDVHVADLSLDGNIVWVGLSFGGAAVPAARAEHSTAVWTGTDGVERMVIFGGIGNSDDTSKVYNDVWVLELGVDGTTGTWTQLQTTGTGPTARRAQAMGISGQIMYVFGGIDATVTSVGDFYQLDLATLVWTQLANDDGPSARDSMSALGLEGKRPGFYVFGGIQASDRVRVADLWFFSPSAQQWSLLSYSSSNSSTTSPVGLSSAVMGATPLDGLFVFGGAGQETGLISASLWHYNLYTSEWSLLYNPDVESPNGLVGAAVATYADPLAPTARASSTSSTGEVRDRYRLAIFGGASRQSGLVNHLWLYGIAPVDQISVSYFVCDDRQMYVDDTGLVTTDISKGVYLSDYYCDDYIDCENLYDEGAHCSPSAEGIFIGFGVVAGLEIVFMAALFLAIVWHRDKVVFKIASIPFLLGVLAAGMWWTSALFTFFGRPNDTACAFRPWWLAIPFTILYGCLFAKEWRMAVLHESAAKFRRLTISNLELFGVVLVLLVPDLILLVVWMAVDRPMAILKEYDGRYHYQCSSDYAELFFWLLVGYQLALLVLGSIQAWRTRSLPTNFGESQYLALAIYDLLFLAAFILPLLYLLQDQPNSLLIIIFIGITVSAGITICLIFIPKFYHLWVKKMDSTSLNDYMSKSKSQATSNTTSPGVTTPFTTTSDTYHNS